MRVLNSDRLFEQTDYRVLLREAYFTRKQRKQWFSYAVWARELQLKSASTLVMILNGQRHPGDELVEKLTSNLTLSGTEAEYFKDLVGLQKLKGKDTREAVLLMERIRRRRISKDFRFVDYETFEAISNWHYLALREMVQLTDFQEDPQWICHKLAFKVTPKQITQAIQNLLRLGLFARDADGKLVSTSAHINTGNDLASAAIRQYHEQSLDNAKEALAKFPTEAREFYSTVFPMPVASMAAAKKWIRRFHDDFCDQFETKPADSLYQMQICFYPVTRQRRTA